jgi:DNA replication protein DnaC
VAKDLETFDFTLTPNLNKQKVLELSRGEWIGQHYNLALIGNSGTGKTHLTVALGQAACRAGQRVKFYTAQALVSQLEEAQKNYRLERMLTMLEKIDLLIVDELGYISFSRSGAELLFQVFADRYERGSILITSNLPFGEWGQIFQGERMTAALLDRFTHRCHIFEMNGESFRFRESVKTKKGVEAARKAGTKAET